MASDEDLMCEVTLGSELAFSELLRRYEGPIAGFLRKQTGDDDAAEDLFQEVWLRVVRSAGGFDARARFKPWIYRIAINVARDWFSRRQSSGLSQLEDLEVVDERARPDDAAVDVARLLATLPAEQREVLMLRYYLDMSESEIAATLRIPPGTVKSRAHAALSRLSARVRGRGCEG